MIVVDTHALVWYLTGPDRLSPTALDALRVAEDEEGIIVPAMVLAEVGQLSVLKRRGFIATDYQVVKDAVLSIDVPGLNLVAFTASAAALVVDLAETIRDPFDLCVTATAVDLGLPLVTTDRIIANSGALQTIW